MFSSTVLKSMKILERETERLQVRECHRSVPEGIWVDVGTTEIYTDVKEKNISGGQSNLIRMELTQ